MRLASNAAASLRSLLNLSLLAALIPLASACAVQSGDPESVDTNDEALQPVAGCDYAWD